MRKSIMSRRKTGGTRLYKGKKLYKVLHVGDGVSLGWNRAILPKGVVYGFYTDYEYKSLPSGARPSRWYMAKGELIVCNNGFHLTTTPHGWTNGKSRFFEAEYQGDMISNDIYLPSRQKLCCRGIRLLREVWPKGDGFTTVKPKVKANAK